MCPVSQEGAEAGPGKATSRQVTVTSAWTTADSPSQRWEDTMGKGPGTTPESLVCCLLAM